MVLAFALLVAPAASGATISIAVDAFGPGSTLTTLTGVPEGTVGSGLTIDGILFQYSLRAGCPMPSPSCGGPLAIDDILGVTNNLNPPSLVAVGNPTTQTVILTFPSLLDAFGYGFAVGATATVPNATTVTLFSGATAVGSLAFTGTPDPVLAGGFAGIHSTIAFDSARITFSESFIFAFDNVRTIPSTAVPVPEPGTVLLVAAGVLLATRWRNQGSKSRSDHLQVP
jgi:hypothetical protein